MPIWTSGGVGPPHYDRPVAMTTPHLPEPGDGRPDGVPGDPGRPAEPVDRVGTLRGAGVGGVDTRRLGRILIGIVLATLAVLVIVFTIVGVHRNQQDDRLHSQGVPVTFTVSGCLGLLGGSGSNAAGYSCRGSYELQGHRYAGVRLPGSTFHAPGARVPSLAVPGDPALVSPVSIVDTEHSSNSVFVLPAVLLVVLVLMLGALALRRRKKGKGTEGTATSAPR
jgi:hypothetical protein